jgi:type VI secretion system protein
MKRSFLDKFKGRSDERHGDRHSLDHVMRNIEAVLNTKEGFGYFRQDFGLGDYTASYGSRDLLKTLTHEMMEEISHHEPRLSGAKLEMQGKDKDFMLHFLLTGIVNNAPCRLHLIFNTLSGQVQVEQAP